MVYTGVWSGFQGAPGYTKLHFFGTTQQSQVDTWGNGVRTFFNALTSMMKTTWTIQVQPTVQEYDVVTGRLLSEWTMTTAPAVVTGTAAAGPWSGGIGAMVAWGTTVIWNGHRVKGRSFLVPLTGIADTDGTLTSAAITTINNAGQALIATGAPGLCIWSKQFSAPPNATQVNGNTALVTSAVTRDKTGILRSRRD